MGCFAYSCSLSWLPIEHGDPVRFFALAAGEGYRFRGDICFSWQPFLLPIKARYNDYGSIEDIESGPVTDAFFQDLDRRSIERDVGKNEYHDVAIRKGMPREAWLKALWEERVQIRGPDNATVSVSQSMVREDVWQFLAGARPEVSTQLDIAAIHQSLRVTTLFDKKTLSNTAASEGSYRELVGVMDSMRRLGRPWAHGSRGPQFGEWDFQFAFARRTCELAHAKLEADRAAVGDPEEGP